MHPAITPELQAAFDGERKEARDARLDDAPTMRAHTVRMHGRLAKLQAATIERLGVGVACRRGCSFCCHLRVEIRPHDAFVLADHINTKLHSAHRARILSRIEANLGRIASLSPQDHVRAGIGCALLEDGACSVYEARPAACRKYYSVSEKTCRDAFADPSAPLTGEIEREEVRLAGNAVALGYAKGLEDAGYDITLYELHFALSRALADPKAEKRYRNRKRAFVKPR